MKAKDQMHAALAAEGLCWTRPTADQNGAEQMVLVDASHPAADPDARNTISLTTYAVVVHVKGVSCEALAAALREAKVDKDDAALMAILES